MDEAKRFQLTIAHERDNLHLQEKAHAELEVEKRRLLSESSNVAMQVSSSGTVASFQ